MYVRQIHFYNQGNEWSQNAQNLTHVTQSTRNFELVVIVLSLRLEYLLVTL